MAVFFFVNDVGWKWQCIKLTRVQTFRAIRNGKIIEFWSVVWNGATQAVNYKKVRSLSGW